MEFQRLDKVKKKKTLLLPLHKDKTFSFCLWNMVKVKTSNIFILDAASKSTAEPLFEVISSGVGTKKKIKNNYIYI